MLTPLHIYYWLSLSGLLSPRPGKIIEFYGSPYALWDSFSGEKKVIEPNIGDKAYAALSRLRNIDRLQEDIDEYYRQGIRMLTTEDKEFPDKLRVLGIDCPPILYCRGDIGLLGTPTVAMVGTRKCTRYGKLMAERIARGLVDAGLTVVSGLADGIDTYSHRATLEADGKTIAVLGSGINKVTPVTNRGLAMGIEKTGLIISEFLPNADGGKHTYPLRNRLISGLSLGVVIVEAASGSGTLHTAKYALEQGREVFSVAGNADSPQSYGTNNLIRNGEAHFVTCAEDVLGILNIDKPVGTVKPKSLQLDVFEDGIMRILEDGAAHFDTLVTELNILPHELSAALSGLELKKLIIKEPSNWYKADK